MPDPKAAPDPAVLPSINEPPGSDVLPDPAQGVPTPGTKPVEQQEHKDADEEPPPEAAHLDDPDEMEAELEEAEDEDELVVNRTTKTTIHRGTSKQTLPHKRKK